MSACVQLLLAKGEKSKICKWLDELGVSETENTGTDTPKCNENKGMFIVPMDTDGNSGFTFNWSNYEIYEDSENILDQHANWEGLDVLELEYKIWDGAVGGQFAIAVAQEIIEQYDVIAAGWDSVGYCKTIEEFKQCTPFRQEIASGRKWAKLVAPDLRKGYEDLTAYYISMRPVYERAAKEALAGSKEFVWIFPEEK
jgi:hypothetical protein